ncbi:hypothetical protein B0T19DRAFT_457495 [Cercophora scortea]|uniref:Uncharacterized protein n=1 Tax=Cercophora scortea TaxID=314031 RepID=A0AAE0IX74_9PEZI|nr:hypothetical protein B0T19DRAFT_457495 [Cercophora scortea]
MSSQTSLSEKDFPPPPYAEKGQSCQPQPDLKSWKEPVKSSQASKSKKTASAKRERGSLWRLLLCGLPIFKTRGHPQRQQQGSDNADETANEKANHIPDQKTDQKFVQESDNKTDDKTNQEPDQTTNQEIEVDDQDQSPPTSKALPTRVRLSLESARPPKWEKPFYFCTIDHQVPHCEHFEFHISSHHCDPEYHDPACVKEAPWFVTTGLSINDMEENLTQGVPWLDNLDQAFNDWLDVVIHPVRYTKIHRRRLEVAYIVNKRNYEWRLSINIVHEDPQWLVDLTLDDIKNMISIENLILVAGEKSPNTMDPLVTQDIFYVNFPKPACKYIEYGDDACMPRNGHWYGAAIGMKGVTLEEPDLARLLDENYEKHFTPAPLE